MYRSPCNSPEAYIEQLKSKFRALEKQKNKPIILTGDTNIDLIHYETDTHAQSITDLALSHGFVQLISRPTRVTDHSATLLDHIYTNQLQRI